ncbi:RNA-binding region-containing protein 3-like [Colias croceus]|uniref:RNA-binding region-containing protein 3-like n=1 Tax=Colias crocea TaxID=72248 RepID=UPI001E27AA7F|nr:RNA-binding region-containing protein 3-like [Colias croceus]XP_045495783.1 RNA-binding region-containing protein 3-like [Colias croceus]
MSKVLLIRHLPINLSFQDKEQLLKHFGAEKVWETAKKRNYIFASFSSVAKAESILRRLHQLEVAQRRLVVEYSFEKEPSLDNRKSNEDSSQATIKIKEFLRVLNAWNPSVNFYQPPPPHLKYKYPDIDANIAVNIIFELFNHAPLYNQLLHLMNKMSLHVPFSDKPEAVDFFKSTFRPFFLDEIFVPPPHLQSEPESEIETDEENDYPKPTVPIQKPLIKRQNILPITRKRPAAVLATASMSQPKKVLISQEEVFEVVTPAADTKKISLVVHQDALQKQVKEPIVVGELGKFEKVDKPPENIPEDKIEEPPTITRKELLKNRLSYSDMKLLPVFKNYNPGEPSMRLYIKNLAKSTTERDVKRVYKGYIENLSDEEQNGFDVRVMQEGRMKGQAFVTFPSIKIAETALNETNGYLLNDKPMVVQFARAANKKTID